MIKIVQINAVYEYSSTGRITMELDLSLKKHGYKSYVFCTNRNNPEEDIYCMGKKLSRMIHGFFSRLTGLQGYFSKNATKKMLLKLDEIKPDIVLLANLHGNYIHVNKLLDYLVNKQIPTVIVLHDCWLFTGHCCHFLEDNCDRWQYGCGRCPAKRKWNTSWFFDQSAKVYADRKKRFEKLKSLTVVGVSDWVMNECKKSFLNRNARFVRIYNWIDLDMFSPKDRILNERPTVLSVSQGWNGMKGLYDIIKIAKDKPGYDFLIVGELSRHVELPPNMKSIGVVNDINNLVAFYRQADVFLHLSYQETFGKVVAEALACGIPAIVYNVTALPELIGPDCGAVVEKGNWKAAESALERIITNIRVLDIIKAFNNSTSSQIITSNATVCQGIVNYEKIRTKCREFAFLNFDKKTLLNQWIELINQIVQFKYLETNS